MITACEEGSAAASSCPLAPPSALRTLSVACHSKQGGTCLAGPREDRVTHVPRLCEHSAAGSHPLSSAPSPIPLPPPASCSLHPPVPWGQKRVLVDLAITVPGHTPGMTWMVMSGMTGTCVLVVPTTANTQRGPPSGSEVVRLE